MQSSAESLEQAFGHEQEADSVIRGETITAAGDADKHTAGGGLTKEGLNCTHTHTQKTGRMSTCCHSLAFHQELRKQYEPHTVIQALARASSKT